MSTANATHYFSVGQPEFWPSVAEYLVYDEILYQAMTRDTYRKSAYKKALLQCARNQVVVDIGTGPNALLATMALEIGAQRVYAIEYLKRAYDRAAEYLRLKALDHRICLIHGDARNVTIPERADICVSALVGSVGSLEGAVPILNAVRDKLLKPEGIMIPQRSVTHIAAVTLPESLRSYETFGILPARYVKRIFDSVGFVFDLRLCIRNFPKSLILSSAGIFEDLRFEGNEDASYSPRDIVLEVQQSGRFDGFLLWLDMSLIDGISINILGYQHSLLPLYLPISEEGLYLAVEDKIVATCTTRSSENGLNPDYIIDAAVVKGDRTLPISVSSTHCPRVRGSNPLYRRLLEAY
jgi:predicted RNA methylase